MLRSPSSREVLLLRGTVSSGSAPQRLMPVQLIELLGMLQSQSGLLHGGSAAAAAAHESPDSLNPKPYNLYDDLEHEPGVHLAGSKKFPVRVADNAGARLARALGLWWRLTSALPSLGRQG